MLFNDIIFGPIISRRLGVSLGINLLPKYGKICSFDCIYCECGYNADGREDNKLPARETVREELEERLKKMQQAGEKPDVITFAGNGEPTMHPEFGQIVDDVIALRNRYFPQAKISVLSNSTMIQKDSVFEALLKIDNAILKLDAADNNKMKWINQPNNPDFNIESLVNQLKRFNGKLIIQSIFIEGSHNGKEVGNTSPEDISQWIAILKEVKPEQVMLYTIDRETPAQGIKKVSKEKLEEIAAQVNAAGLKTSVSG